jgi:hypothetical protein
MLIWGKVGGAAAGFVAGAATAWPVGAPLGALIGGLAGHLIFDRVGSDARNALTKASEGIGFTIAMIVMRPNAR